VARPGIKIEPLEVEIVGFRVGGGPLLEGRPFPGQKRGLQVLDDGRRDLVLDVEDVALFPVARLKEDKG